MASSSKGSRRRSPKTTAAARPYHHGNLREALVAAALEILRKEGAEALTLRAVARAAGVSQTAPYRHFADRRALIAAVAQEGFTRLGETISRAVQSEGPGLSALRRGMEAYVRFAHDHPAEYHVMFGAELAQREDLPGLSSAALDVFGLLRSGIERLQRAGVLAEGDPGLAAITSWATLHGLVMLSLDGQTRVAGHSIESLVDAAVGLLLVGMGAAKSEAAK